VRPFFWTFMPSTDGNEDDFFGILHGDTEGPDAFQPREALRSFEATNALFGQTEPDQLASFEISGLPLQYSGSALERYAFRDKVSGKRIYAFWLGVRADPEDRFVSAEVRLKLHDPSIRNPILIDLRTGAVQAIAWKDKSGSLDVPLKDSAMAVADASYLDWPEVPPAPAGLHAARADGRVRLQWATSGAVRRVEVQRSLDYGPWQPAGEPATAQRRDGANAAEFSEPLRTGHVTWRVRAWDGKGASPWSNPAWIEAR
jgi:hypothetical protein